MFKDDDAVQVEYAAEKGNADDLAAMPAGNDNMIEEKYVTIEEIPQTAPENEVAVE